MKDWSKIVLAFEPGSKGATPDAAEETAKGIRKWVEDNVSVDEAKILRI